MTTEGIHRRAQEIGPSADVGRIVALLHAEDRKAVRAAGRVRPAIARGAALIAAACFVISAAALREARTS